jgi:hypothetical protein
MKFNLKPLMLVPLLASCTQPPKVENSKAVEPAKVEFLLTTTDSNGGEKSQTITLYNLGSLRADARTGEGAYSSPTNKAELELQGSNECPNGSTLNVKGPSVTFQVGGFDETPVVNPDGTFSTKVPKSSLFKIKAGLGPFEFRQVCNPKKTSFDPSKINLVQTLNGLRKGV